MQYFLMLYFWLLFLNEYQQMSLQLNISNSLTELAHGLSANLRHQRVSVFQPNYIVTQTEGMNNWLKLQIAANNGIAANCLFLSPNEIVQQVYYLLGGRFPNMLSAQNLTWLLYTVLGESDFIKRFPGVSSYYNHDGHDRDLKRMALAEKTADLFDQYQIYRPEWIELWNRGKADETAADEWQQYLWIKAKELSGERLPDKTVIGLYIRDSLKDAGNREKLRVQMPALHVFGLSITTDYHLDLLFEIAKTAEVYFHIVNPAPTVYWFEDRSEKQLATLKRKGLADRAETNTGNTLLTSWGRVIQDTFMMLFKNEELLNSFQEAGVAEPATDTLLHKIQNDIYNGAGSDERNPLSLADVNDGSVSISACYTIAREVEVLYNYLVYLVDQKKELLSPRDIVVMVTDIDSYAPYIKAVFKNAPYQFHFTIADESFANGDTMVSALAAILSMNRRNFKAEEVMQLLDSGYIRKRFSITDTGLVRKAVSAAGIRFGMTGKEEDDTRFVSWEYGIKKIMYGICISGDKVYDDPGGESLFPLDMVEGNDSQLLVRFCHFIQVLMDSINERERPRTIADWVVYTEQLIQNLICEPEEDVSEDYPLLLKQLTKFNVADEFMNEKIAFDIFKHSLLQSVSGAGRSGSFAGGGITFCSLIPMRSIPFKVVALLGLNFDKFPRKEAAASFNLVEKDKRRRGDRNIKENDKHLFLETVLSAKEFLYISYIGQSAKDNTLLPPSALVDELMDYIETGCDEPEKVRGALIVRHPLHSFSRQYSRSLPGYHNYIDVKRPGTVQAIDNAKIIEPFTFEEISLEGLLSFLKHPFKAYYNKVLDIYYNDDEVLLSDTEVFNLDVLQKWSLKPKLVKMEAQEIAALKQRLVKTGGLPLKNMADVAVDELEDELAKVRELFKECVGDETEEKVAFEMTVDNSLFKGNLTSLYGNRLIFISYSGNENRYLLDAYIRYLTAVASGFSYEMYFISAGKEAVYTAANITQKEATYRLRQLVQLYKKGHTRIIAFFPGFKIKPADIDLLEETIVQKALNDFFHNFNFPCNDQYLLNEYRNGYFRAADIVERLQANGRLLIKPLAEIFPGYYK